MIQDIAQWKIDVVEVYQETSFKECVMYCTDEGIISADKEKEAIQEYNEDEDREHEVVSDFFDYLGINEETFEDITDYLLTQHKNKGNYTQNTLNEN